MARNPCAAGVEVWTPRIGDEIVYYRMPAQQGGKGLVIYRNWRLFAFGHDGERGLDVAVMRHVNRPPRLKDGGESSRVDVLGVAVHVLPQFLLGRGFGLGDWDVECSP